MATIYTYYEYNIDYNPVNRLEVYVTTRSDPYFTCRSGAKFKVNNNYNIISAILILKSCKKINTKKTRLKDHNTNTIKERNSRQ